MPVSKSWRVIGCVLLVVLSMTLLFFVVWNIYLFGSSDIYCERADGVAGLGSTIYVQTSDKELNFRYFKSDDNGYTWKTADRVPENLHDALDRLSPDSTLACSPIEAKICYRILSQNEFSELEQSVDGGQSWEKVSISTYLPNKKDCSVSSGPKSLAFVKSNTSNEAYSLVVAVGTNGVLMLSPEGTWTQHSIDKLHGRG